MSKSHNPTIKQIETTNKAYKLRYEYGNDRSLAAFLQLSRVTMYTRLKSSNWTAPEMLYVEYLSNPKLNKVITDLNIF